MIRMSKSTVVMRLPSGKRVNSVGVSPPGSSIRPEQELDVDDVKRRQDDVQGERDLDPIGVGDGDVARERERERLCDEVAVQLAKPWIEIGGVELPRRRRRRP